MDLKEAKSFLKHIAESQKKLENCKTTKFYKNENEAIETVLQELENSITKNKELEKMVDLILEHLSVWAMCTDDEGCFCTVKGKECNVMTNECEGEEHITCKECLMEYFKRKVRDEK